MKVQCLNSDIISILPQNIIENILTCMPIGDAIRTSILSRKWRSYWKSMPKLVFDGKLVKVASNCQQLKKYKLASAILHVLLLHKGPILEIKLNVGELDMDSEFDQIICYLSRNNNVQKLVLEISYKYRYKLPSSFISLQGLTSITLTHCDFDLQLTINGFSRLKSVCFIHVRISFKTLQRFLSNCPRLTYVILAGCGDEEDFGVEKKCTFVELLQCVPLITNLYISHVYMMFLGGGMPQQLPTSLVNLRCLGLNMCLTRQDDISSALCLMRSSPYLKNICFTIYEISDASEISMNLMDFQDSSDFDLDHLEEVKFENFRNVGFGLEFVKLIMAKTPALKKIRIELDKEVSVDEALKILRDLIRVPFPRASPSAILTVEPEKLPGESCYFGCAPCFALSDDS